MARGQAAEAIFLAGSDALGLWLCTTGVPLPFSHHGRQPGQLLGRAEGLWGDTVAAPTRSLACRPWQGFTGTEAA